MREFKFRAFIQGQDGKYICSNSDTLFPHIFWNNVYKGIYDTNPEQYTGLKDKNSKEIYEGDIVDFEYNDCLHMRTFTKTQGRFKTGCFLWSDYYLCFGIKCGKDTHQMIPRDVILYVEIIGNIHENPELLDKGE